MNITNYIKERIRELRTYGYITDWTSIDELQAVLSKIEEIERKEFEKIVQVNSKS